MSEIQPRPVESAGPFERTGPFERKVQLSTYALFLERLWPRLWLIIGVIGLIVPLITSSRGRRASL